MDFVTVKITFTTGTQVTFNDVSFLQYHNADRYITFISQEGKTNEYRYNISDILSIDITK